MFTPLFIAGAEPAGYGSPHFDHSFEHVMSKQMDYSFFLVSMSESVAKLSFHDMAEGEYRVGNFAITSRYMHHSVLCLGYRIVGDGKVPADAGDTEPYYETVSGDREPADEE